MLTPSHKGKRPGHVQAQSGSVVYVVALCIGVLTFGILRTIERLMAWGIGAFTGLVRDLTFVDVWRDSTGWLYVWFEWFGFSWIPCLLAGGAIGVASYYITVEVPAEQRDVWERRLYWASILIWLLWTMRLLPLQVERLRNAPTSELFARTLLASSIYYALSVLFSAIIVWLTLSSVRSFLFLKRRYL
jgi:hypothetical protein